MSDLVFASATELAACIRDRRVSATEMLEAHLAQIARHNPRLNAVVTVDADAAARRARAADRLLSRGECWGPLHGVPILVKDTLETAGLRTTAGHAPLAGYVPDEDAVAVGRLRAAGAVVLGKTNTPELAEGAETDNPLFGRTQNPWDAGRTCGGSSGGSAVAVAAGMSPLALGSDLGGSLRIPAHYCGVVTIKPSQWLVPTTGHIPELPGALRGIRNSAVVGPMARDPEDLALALRLMAGPDGRQWEVPPVPVDPAPEPRVADLRLRWTDGWDETQAGPEVRTTLARLVDDLRAAGATVEHRAPTGLATGEVADTLLALFMAEISPSLPPETGRPVPSVVEYLHLLDRRNHFTRVVDDFLGDCDGFLLPVTNAPAPAILPMADAAQAGDGGVAAYLFPFSLTGHPAVVLPGPPTAAGLPIGVQLVGRRWADGKLLAVAKAIARVAGGVRRPPGLTPPAVR